MNKSHKIDHRAACATMFKIVNFFTKSSDQRERTIVDRAVARIWLAAQPPCATMFGTGGFRIMLAALGTLVLSVCALVATVPALAEDGPKGQQAHILTPKPSPKPRINGANVFGVRPGRPFLFAIPATGKRPMSFAAEGLPPGLVLDEKSGRISGSTTTRGIHHVMLRIISNSAPLEQAVEYTGLAQMCRTSGDLIDLWDRSQMDESKRRWALGIREVWLEQEKWQRFSRPGHWNNPCPLRVGMLGGWDNKPIKASRLTPDEQYAHISLWCLWASPIIIGCPVEKLDPFTLSLLSNDEVLEVNQDPLGQQAGPVSKDTEHEVLAKDLEDGSKAVGLFNLALEASEVTVKWEDLDIQGKQTVRDLWRQEDIGGFQGKFGATVPGHGVVLVRITPAR